FEIADWKLLALFGSDGAQRNRGRARITIVGPCDDFKHTFQIAYGAGQRSDDANESKRTSGAGEVRRGRNAPRGRLESADTGEVSWDTDGAPAIATHATRGAAGGDGSGFSSAGTARCAR